VAANHPPVGGIQPAQVVHYSLCTAQEEEAHRCCLTQISSVSQAEQEQREAAIIVVPQIEVLT